MYGCMYVCMEDAFSVPFIFSCTKVESKLIFLCSNLCLVYLTLFSLWAGIDYSPIFSEFSFFCTELLFGQSSLMTNVFTVS